MNRILSLLVALPLIVTFGPQAAAQSAKVIRADPPQPAVLPGFDRAHCILRPGRLRICKATSDEGGLLIIEKAGKRVVIWPTQPFAGETSDFEVLQADLDGDRRSELILANHDGSSNGIGIDSWTISVFPDSGFRRLQAPLIFSVEEYGALGTFVPKGNRIHILTTKWLWSKDPKGRRGEGLYLVGQWWRYQSGELVPVIERPVLARRFLASFASERGRTHGNQREPYLWFKRPKVDVLKESLLIGGHVKDEQRGVLQSVLATPFTESETEIEIIFKPERGQSLTLKYPASNFQDHIGDAASGWIYPDKYFPSTPERWLRDRRARLITYWDGTEVNRVKVLWLTRDRD